MKISACSVSCCSDFRDKNLVSACGLFCGSCGIFIASHENDNAKLLQYAIVLNQHFNETQCNGCKSEKKSAHCSELCPIVNCTMQKGVEYCGDCEAFPCDILVDFKAKSPLMVELIESQTQLSKIGWERWLEEMINKYTCPQCHSVNRAFDISCRVCGNQPGSSFAEKHKSILENYLSIE